MPLKRGVVQGTKRFTLRFKFRIPLPKKEKTSFSGFPRGKSGKGGIFLNKKKDVKNKSILLLATASVLSALSILLGKYLAINLGETIRISFENFPILLAGFYFGPLIAATVGIIADLVGCLLVGYSINPIITLGAAAIGLVSGFCGKFFRKNKTLNLLFCVLPSHLIGSVFIKTIGLSLYYGMPFLATLGWRSLTYFLITILEVTLLFILTGNKAFSSQMKRVRNELNKKQGEKNEK